MNFTTLGYGEDALTYRVLSEDLSRFLKALNDDTPAQVVMFRPSCGRGGGFGEFDAIVVTRSSVYLIEAKWGRVRPVTLKPEQVQRHKVMRWLIERWSSGLPWDMFHEDNKADFAKEFPKWELWKQKSVLAKNLTFILNQIKRDDEDRKVVDVLLFHLRTGNAAEISVEPPTFRSVILDYPTVEGSDYVALASGTEPG